MFLFRGILHRAIWPRYMSILRFKKSKTNVFSAAAGGALIAPSEDTEKTEAVAPNQTANESETSRTSRFERTAGRGLWQSRSKRHRRRRHPTPAERPLFRSGQTH